MLQNPKGSAIGEAVRRRLRALRLAKGMSQAELARRTNMAASTLSRLESGDRHLSIDHIAPLATALGVSVGELIASTAQGRTLGGGRNRPQWTSIYAGSATS